MSIELFLSVPMGLEDVAVRKLPALLCKVATKIHYALGSGYLIVILPSVDGCDGNHKDVLKALSNLVNHPPLCIFSAHISLGNIDIPQSIFKDSTKLLAFTKQDFGLKDAAPSQPPVARTSSSQSTIPTSDTGIPASSAREPHKSPLQWDETLGVLILVSPPAFAERAGIPGATDHSNNKSGNSNETMAHIRFRASFDRGDVQHKGVRSQDLAAALGSLTGTRFPQWNVNLTEFDVEIIGRWIQDVEEASCVYFKGTKETGTEEQLPNISKKRARESDERGADNAAQIVEDKQEGSDSMTRMQVGMTLPLALSTCLYRFRPKDGRTSLRMEIAYNLIGFADPKPGDVVFDTCAGVGTIPIVGAAHYPECLFLGSEILTPNVEKANENARAMFEKVNEAQQTKTRHSHSRPDLILGDAKAVCLRSNSVDLIISDLPWGQRESSHLSNCKLYPRLIKEIIRMLRTNGRAVLVTGERKLLQRQLDAPFAKPYLGIVQKREITIGFKVVVFELVRL